METVSAHYTQQERGPCRVPYSAGLQELHPTKAMLAARLCAFGEGACSDPVFVKSRQLCRRHYWQWQSGTLGPMLERPCLNCGENFTPLRRRNAKCCSRDCSIETARLRKEYGVTGLEVLEMLKAQRSRCAICGDFIFRGVRGAGAGQGGLHIDHCHDTGRVRGLLCGECNRGIGSLKDDPDLLLAAAKYLKS